MLRVFTNEVTCALANNPSENSSTRQPSRKFSSMGASVSSPRRGFVLHMSPIRLGGLRHLRHKQQFTGEATIEPVDTDRWCCARPCDTHRNSHGNEGGVVVVGVPRAPFKCHGRARARSAWHLPGVLFFPKDGSGILILPN